MAVSLDTFQGVSCPVCYTDYSDEVAELVPRILSCGHTYCTQCLEKLLNSEDEQQEVVFSIRQRQSSRVHVLKSPRLSRSTELKCPICNSSSSIQKGDITTLTKNYAVLNCRQKSNDSSNSGVKSKIHYCPEHDHDQRVFCKDCKAVICVYCQLYGSHKGHECALAADLVKPAIETLESAEVTLNNHIHDVVGARSLVKAAMDRLKSSQQECQDSVQRYYKSIMELLDKEKEKRTEEINHWVEEQLDVLQAQIQCLTDAHNECEANLEDCRALIGGDPLDALAQHESKLLDVGSICKQMSGLSFDPLINPVIKCICRSTKGMVQKVSNGCKITLECLDGEHNRQHESGEEATEGVGGAIALGAPCMDKARYASSPLNSSGGLPRLEPLDIKFHDWPPKLEPLQLNLKELSTLETISIEHLDASADSADFPRGSADSADFPRGSAAAESSSIVQKNDCAGKSWFDNFEDSSSPSIPGHIVITSDSESGYVNEHRTETDGELSPHTGDHVREERGTDADEEDEGEGEEGEVDDMSSHDHLHHSDNDASLQPMLDAGSDLQISFHCDTR